MNISSLNLSSMIAKSSTFSLNHTYLQLYLGEKKSSKEMVLTWTKHTKGPDEVIAKPPIWLKLLQMNICNPSRKDHKGFFFKIYTY